MRLKKKTECWKAFPEVHSTILELKSIIIPELYMPMPWQYLFMQLFEAKLPEHIEWVSVNNMIKEVDMVYRRIKEWIRELKQ